MVRFCTAAVLAVFGLSLWGEAADGCHFFRRGRGRQPGYSTGPVYYAQPPNQPSVTSGELREPVQPKLEPIPDPLPKPKPPPKK